MTDNWRHFATGEQPTRRSPVEDFGTSQPPQYLPHMPGYFESINNSVPKSALPAGASLYQGVGGNASHDFGETADFSHQFSSLRPALQLHAENTIKVEDERPSDGLIGSARMYIRAGAQTDAACEVAEKWFVDFGASAMPGDEARRRTRVHRLPFATGHLRKLLSELPSNVDTTISLTISRSGCPACHFVELSTPGPGNAKSDPTGFSQLAASPSTASTSVENIQGSQTNDPFLALMDPRLQGGDQDQAQNTQTGSFFQADQSHWVPSFPAQGYVLGEDPPAELGSGDVSFDGQTGEASQDLFDPGALPLSPLAGLSSTDSDFEEIATFDSWLATEDHHFQADTASSEQYDSYQSYPKPEM